MSPDRATDGTSLSLAAAKRIRGELPHVPPAASPVGSTVTLSLDAPARSEPVAVVRDVRRGDTWRVGLCRSGSRWQAELLLPAEPTILSYHFELAGGGTIRERRQVEGVIGPIYGRWRASDFRIAVYLPGTPPEWARDQVIYQIVPDRFARSGAVRPRRDGVYGRPALHLEWGDPPEVPPKGRDFFGGDLEGVRQRLDHLADLGVTCLYFTPIFASPTNHRYDALDYFRVDPALGEEEDLRRLVADAAARRIRVILDISINHCSSDSEHFRAAQADRRSPTFRWFTFKKWPDRYLGWANVRQMPQFTESPEVEDYFFGPDGVTRYWLRTGIAGWRLDVTPWKSERFWQRFARAMRETQAASSPVRGTEPLYLVAEDWGDATRRLVGDTFDATMNYRFAYAVRGFAIGRLGPSELDDRLEILRRDTPEPAFYAQMNLLTSHDTLRLRTLLGKKDHLARLRLAVGLQLGYPGAPMVYYGEEAGLEGRFAEDGRRAYPWNALNGGPGAASVDRETFRLYRTAIRARRDSVALRRGSVRTVWIRDRDRTYGFIREHPEQTVVVLVNGGTRPARLVVPLGRREAERSIGLAVGPWVDLLGACQDATFEGGRLRVIVPASTACWLTPSPRVVK